MPSSNILFSLNFRIINSPSWRGKNLIKWSEDSTNYIRVLFIRKWFIPKHSLVLESTSTKASVVDQRFIRANDSCPAFTIVNHEVPPPYILLITCTACVRLGTCMTSHVLPQILPQKKLLPT